MISTNAILLCAGLSSRFGAGSKLLHPYKNKPLLHHAIDTLLSTSVAEIILVTGFKADEVQLQIEQHYASSRLRVTHNLNYKIGMASSIQAGLRLSASEKNALICLGDMPDIRSDTIEKMLHSAAQSPHRFAYVPACDNIPGNPVLFNATSLPALLQLKGDEGAKKMLLQNRHLVETVIVDDQGIYRDFDTPDDFKNPF